MSSSPIGLTPETATWYAELEAKLKAVATTGEWQRWVDVKMTFSEAQEIIERRKGHEEV